MAKIRVTKEFRFEMAHALEGYDGLCKNIHGHSYELNVTVTGEPLSDPSSPKLGMVLDFGDLKKIVNEVIVSKFDHALALNRVMAKELAPVRHTAFDKVIYLDYQPTSELMVVDFAHRIAALLPPTVKLHSVLLRETATSYAEWFAEDN